MKLVTKTSIKNLKGEDIKDGDVDFTIGKALSNILLESKTGGKMKMFNMATKCYNGEVLELDDSDLALVKTSVEATALYNNLANGQILIALEAVKPEEPKTPKK